MATKITQKTKFGRNSKVNVFNNYPYQSIKLANLPRNAKIKLNYPKNYKVTVR